MRYATRMSLNGERPTLAAAERHSRNPAGPQLRAPHARSQIRLGETARIPMQLSFPPAMDCSRPDFTQSKFRCHLLIIKRDLH